MGPLPLAAVAHSAPLPAPPAGAAVDADLREWTAPPLLVLGPEDTVGTFEPPTGPDDLTAEVWLAFDPAAGLYVAVRARDDVATPCGPDADAQRTVRSDHAEIWLSFGDPPLPPVGWGAAIGEITLASPEDCAEHEGFDCRRWYSEQQALRKQLTAAFRPQYLLSERGLQPVSGGSPAAPLGEAKLALAPGGWVAEARIPPSALPPSPAEPIASVRVLVELVDNDRGWDRQESFLSSSPRRKLSDPRTWRTFPLAAPSASTHPSGLAARLVGTDGWWREADPSAPRLHRYLNYDTGYQWEPAKTSPITWDLTLPAPSPLGTALAWVIHTGDGDFLAASRDGRSIGFFPLRAANRIATATASDRTLVLAARSTFLGEFGPRPGSANVVAVVRAFGLSSDGQLAELLSGMVETEVTWRLELGTAPDGTLAGLRLVDANDPAEALSTWRWSGARFEDGDAPSASWKPLVQGP